MHNIGAKVFTCDIDETSLKTLPEGIITFVCDVSKSSNLDPILRKFCQVVSIFWSIMLVSVDQQNPLKKSVMMSGTVVWLLALMRSSIA
jgi:hypothetical protein